MTFMFSKIDEFGDVKLTVKKMQEMWRITVFQMRTLLKNERIGLGWWLCE